MQPILSRLLLILILLLSAESIQAQTMQFRGLNRDGIYPDTGLLNSWPEHGPFLTATIKGIGDGYGSPSINEKGIYIAGMIDSSGYIFHYNMQHELQWKVHYGRVFNFKFPGARATPTLEEDRLYFSGSYGDAFCLNNETGEFIWRTNIFDTYHSKTSKWGYTESPLIYETLVILTPGGPGHNVIALDKMSGELAWSIDLDSAVNAYNSPVIIKHLGEDYILLNTTLQLMMIRPLTGEVVYSHPIQHFRDMHATSALYKDGKLFHTTGYGVGAALLGINESNKRIDTLYYNPDLDNRLSGLISFEGTVFGTSDRKKQWLGVDLESGKTLFTSRELKPGSFLLADNKYFIFTEMGEVALAKPGKEGFEVISRFKIPIQPARFAFAHPVIHQGILYIRYREHLWLYHVGKP